MAETFALDIAKSILGKIGSLVLDEIILAWGLQDDLERLKEKLSAINAVLLDAEKQKSKNHKIQLWLENLQDVLYDAEDVLDEFDCEAVKRHAVKTSGSTRRKVRHLFSSSIPVAFRPKMAHKMNNIFERLAEIASLKSEFGLNEQTINGCGVSSGGETEINPNIDSFSGLIGREEDKKRIINLLLKASEADDRGEFRVIPIAGMGGLGKTALAKSVYDDVATHFEVQMQVCVSDGFDLKQLIAKMIKSATGKKCNDLDTNELQSNLEDILVGKKYLLLLDDVWNDDPKKWFLLVPSLSKGATGSAIMVTTRCKRVAEIMGTMPAYDLSLLDQNACLSLFYKCAFKEGQKERYPNLVKIGDNIVAKCKQVPLAVVNLGSQLFGVTSENEWKSIRDNRRWEEKEGGILPALRISYDRLPSYLKRCFLSCSIFPKDFEFSEWFLVEFWMALGLIQSSSEEKLEDVGLPYVTELLSKCFFQDVDKKWRPFMKFKMHDIVHDLALSLTHNKHLVITSNNVVPVSKAPRQLLVQDSSSFSQALSKFPNKLDHVRAIFFDSSESICNRDLEKCFSICKHLRLLCCHNCQYDLPKSIGTLKHLRFLALESDHYLILPKSVFKLANLQTLLVPFEELPEDVRYMISLRVFGLYTNQKHLPEGGLGCLGSLQCLWIRGCENLEHLCEDIHYLKSLRRLVIVGCGRLISLPRGMNYLTALELLHIEDCESLDLATMEEEEGEEEERNQLSLSLQQVTLIKLPATLALPGQFLQRSAMSLKVIEIEICPNITKLPECMGDLRSLRSLRITGCPKLEKRCQREAGEDWPKIAHIPEIVVEESNHWLSQAGGMMPKRIRGRLAQDCTYPSNCC